MLDSAPHLPLLGGRLSIDFVNSVPPNSVLSWDRLIQFLDSTDIVSTERGVQLLSLPQMTRKARKFFSRRRGAS